MEMKMAQRIMRQVGGKFHRAMGQRATVCNSRSGIRSLVAVNDAVFTAACDEAFCEKCFNRGGKNEAIRLIAINRATLA